MRNLVALGAIAAALYATPLAAETTASVPGVTTPPMTAHDLVTLPRLGAPAVNAAGTLAVFGVTTTDPQTLARQTGYYLLDLTRPGAQPVALDFGIKASAPAFGPDGALYVLSSGHPQGEGVEPRGRVWRIALGKDGKAGTPTLVAGFPDADIAGFKLSPDGRAIALWAEVPRDCPDFGCASQPAKHLPGPGTGRLYDGAGGFTR
ncbi:MAG: S9 family peptidase, partial [Erythrobacter sp.]